MFSISLINNMLKKKIIPIDNTDNIKLLREYIANIRNLKKLDDNMINKISDMTHEDKLKIIITFNEILDTISDIILTD